MLDTAVVPGSFDPITTGHLDLIERTARIFSRVIVTLSPNAEKKYMFEANDRINAVRAAVAHMPNVEAVILHGLLADFAAEQNAVLVKGARGAVDFDYEKNLLYENMKDEEKIYGEDGKMPLKNDLKDQEKEGADLPSPEKSGEEEEKRRPAAAEKEELALELERLFAENQSLSAQLTALRKEQEAAAEKAEGLAFLEEMAGGRNTELYKKALKKAKKAEIDQMLLHYARQPSKLEGNSIGILNVQKRVKLLCGQKYGLSYTENEEGGVTARLLLPIREEEP